MIKRGDRLQSKITGAYYNVLSVKGENYRVATDGGHVTFWRPLKEFDEFFAVIDTRPDDTRNECLYYSYDQNEFLIVGLNKDGDMTYAYHDPYLVQGLVRSSNLKDINDLKEIIVGNDMVYMGRL